MFEHLPPPKDSAERDARLRALPGERHHWTTALVMFVLTVLVTVFLITQGAVTGVRAWYGFEVMSGTAAALGVASYRIMRGRWCPRSPPHGFLVRGAHASGPGEDLAVSRDDASVGRSPTGGSSRGLRVRPRFAIAVLLVVVLAGVTYAMGWRSGDTVLFAAGLFLVNVTCLEYWQQSRDRSAEEARDKKWKAFLRVPPFALMTYLFACGAVGAAVRTDDWTSGIPLFVGGILGGGLVLGSLAWIARTSREYDERKAPRQSLD